LDPVLALAQAQRMAVEGADIIDAGAESARTNRAAISMEEEIARFTAFITVWQKWCAAATDQPPPFDEEQVWPPLLSLNTWRPEVVQAILPLGGDLLNDIGALPDDRNARLCARHGAALLIMHSVGEPKQPHTDVHYPDIMAELDRFFTEKLVLCAEAGLPLESVILDPGIDFAKQREDNLAVFRNLPALAKFQRPVLLPVSRKTVIGEVLGLRDPLDRDAGTLACIARGVTGGARIFRVHHVQAAAQAVKMLWTLESGGESV
ncbi:MAG: dihydropteroate synthase, partial [Verrucomicrobiaceae bacterium]